MCSVIRIGTKKRSQRTERGPECGLLEKCVIITVVEVNHPNYNQCLSHDKRYFMGNDSIMF